MGNSKRWKSSTRYSEAEITQMAVEMLISVIASFGGTMVQSRCDEKVRYSSPCEMLVHVNYVLLMIAKHPNEA